VFTPEVTPEVVVRDVVHDVVHDVRIRLRSSSLRSCYGSTKTALQECDNGEKVNSL
jgi:hypothetical protein